MDDLIKFIKEKYIEDLISPIDFHKLIIFVMFLGVLGVVMSTGYLDSIWLKIGSTHIKTIFNFESKIWTQITLIQILISSILTLTISPLYSRLKSDFFQAFSKIKNLNDYVQRLTTEIRQKLTGNQALDLVLVKEISKDIKIRKKKLTNFHVWGEISISCLLISIIGLTKTFNLTDILFAFIFLSIAIFTQWKAYIYYIEKFLPLILPEKILIDGKFHPDSEY